MKKILACILAAAVCLSLFAGCGGSGAARLHTLYVRDDSKSSAIIATFLNSDTGEQQEIAMRREREEDDCTVFSCEADAAKYNLVNLCYDGLKTLDLAFNPYVSGWYLSSYGLVPYTEGSEIVERPAFTTETFRFRDRDKEVYIWTPADYDPDAAEPYATIYLFDGQYMLVRDFMADQCSGCWNVAESVTSMMSQSGNKAIVVAVSTLEQNRSEELSPDLGEAAQPVNTDNERHDGSLFSDFLRDTVVPFVRAHYHVYTDAAHTSVAGSSLGGMEAFYVGMENPDIFGVIGAMSPAFWLYDTETWSDYLSQKDFSANAPLVYIYSGNLNDNEYYARSMKRLLSRMNYPDGKLFYHYNPDGAHLTPYWRNIFPEFLVAMFSPGSLTLQP